MHLVHTAHVPAGSGPFPTVLALHGWGANAHDLLGLAPYFGDGVMTLCPQGTVTVPIGPSTQGYGWFPLEPGAPPDARAFMRGSADLRTFVDQAFEKYPVDPKRVVVLAFSQGGLMAYDLALRAPERFAGLVALSSWLPAPLAAALPRLAAQRELPVLVLHGTRDPMVAVEKARESRAVLEDFGVKLTYEELAMGHEIRAEALERVLHWLGERF